MQFLHYFMVFLTCVQDYWDSASCAGTAEQPDNPRPLQQSDDRLPADHLGPAIKPDHTVSLASRYWLSPTPSACCHTIVMLANVNVTHAQVGLNHSPRHTFSAYRCVRHTCHHAVSICTHPSVSIFCAVKHQLNTQVSAKICTDSMLHHEHIRLKTAVLSGHAGPCLTTPWKGLCPAPGMA